MGTVVEELTGTVDDPVGHDPVSVSDPTGDSPPRTGYRGQEETNHWTSRDLLSPTVQESRSWGETYFPVE